ncbi:MAG: hypothetical protein C4575_00095 [Desulforudis sp.]|nr:MAG: hypothetical protein C4575_00095 [Desulforudis sp.]
MRLRNISLPALDIGMVRETARNWRPYLLGMGVLLMLFLGVWGALASATIKAQANVRDLQERRVVVEREVATLQEYADIEVRAVSAEKLVQQALGTNPDWQALLTSIGRDLPNGVWITEFTASYKAGSGATQADTATAGSGELLLRGWGANHAEVATWVDGIAVLPGLADVRYQFTSKDKVDGRDVVRFEVKTTLLPGEPYQPAVRGGVR